MNELYGKDMTMPQAPAFTKPMPKREVEEKRKKRLAKGGMAPKRESGRGGYAY